MKQTSETERSQAIIWRAVELMRERKARGWSDALNQAKQEACNG